MTVTVTEAPPAPDGSQRWMWRATAGEGHKAGIASSEALARKKADAAKRHLLAVEVHDPDAIEADEFDRPGHTIMRTVDGVIVEVPNETVDALLAAGYTIVADQDTIPQRTNERPGPVEVSEEPKRRGPGRPAKEALGRAVTPDS